MATETEAAAEKTDSGEQAASDAAATSQDNQDTDSGASAEAAAGAEGGAGGASGVEIPDAYKGEDGNPDISKLIEKAKAADAAAEANGDVPDSPEGYELPEKVEVEGQAFEINKDDPALQAFLKDAHERGLGGEAIKNNLNFYAQALASQQKRAQDEAVKSAEAEFEKIGSDAKERFTAVQKALTDHGVPAELAESIPSRLHTAEEFKALETLVNKLNGDGESGRSVNGDGRSQPKDHAQVLYG